MDTPIAVESCAVIRIEEANHLTYQSLVCRGVILFKFIIKIFLLIIEGSANHFLLGLRGGALCEISLWILITFIDCILTPSFNGGVCMRE
jgi:hypothetical protein